MADKKISELPFGDLTPNSIIPIISNSITSQTTFGVLLSKIPTSSGSNIDTFTTGGTYSDGTAVFINNTGGTYSVTGFSIGNEYWSSGTGLNSVVQNNSNNQANGINSFVVGSGNTANGDYSIAMGMNSITKYSSLFSLVKTQKIFTSGITTTLSDPINGEPGFILNGDVITEWDDYFIYYPLENIFILSDTSGNTQTLVANNYWDAYYDGIGSTYILFSEITASTFTSVSANTFIDINTEFTTPSFVFGNNSSVSGANSVVLGANLTGTTSDTTYVDMLNIKRFLNNTVILGDFAGSNASGITDSNLIGYGAGASATGVFYSNFLGGYAGASATNASQSNFLGYDAGHGATNALQSNFLGQSAGQNAINANNSNFFGELAGKNATNASNSNFIGKNAGLNATSAWYSNFIGYNAGTYATNSQYSNFIGTQAGANATNAQSSNFMGPDAGYLATDAPNSNFFGRYAGKGATNANNSNFFGELAGQNAINASYSNLFGYQVGDGFNIGSLGSNNIIIGTNISLPSGTTNSINLGGVLFGTGTYSTTNTYPSIVGQANGKIGVNIVNPTNTLHIYSESNNTSGLRLERLTSSATTSTGQPIGVDASGNVVTISASTGSNGSTSPITVVNTSSLFTTGLSGTGLNSSGVTNSNFIGTNAGNGATGASQSNFIGLNAGSGAINASYSNLFGYNVGNASSTSNSLGSNNIIIGTNISLSAGTTDSINLGGVLFGKNTYSATAGTPSTIGQTGGTISINTNNGTDTFNIESSSFGVAGQTFMELLSFKNTNIGSDFNFNYTNFAVTNLVSGNSFVADTGNYFPYTTVPSIYKITSGGTISLVGNPNSGTSNTQIVLSVNSADTIYYGFQSDVRIMTTGGTVSTLCTLPSVISRIVWNKSSEMFILCANLNIYKVLTNGTFSVFHTLTEECYEMSILSTGELIVCIISSSPFNITSNSIYKISLDGLSRTTLANATSGMTGTVAWSMIDKSDNIFTSRYSPYRIFKTTPNGVTTTFFTPSYYTYGMAVDSLNNIYIADMKFSSQTLRKFTNDGRLISSSNMAPTFAYHMVMNSTNSIIVIRQGGVNFLQTNMGRSLLKVNDNGKVMYSDEIITESNTTYLPLSTILNTSADTTGKSIVTKEYAPITISDNIAVNNTTVDLTLSDLNSQYPSVYRGFKVHALSIVSGATIYEKTTTGWAKYASTIVV